jgi:hypothetical protein
MVATVCYLGDILESHDPATNRKLHEAKCLGIALERQVECSLNLQPSLQIDPN